MSTKDERARILSMLEEGKITAAEAAQLIRALSCDRPEQPPDGDRGRRRSRDRDQARDWVEHGEIPAAFQRMVAAFGHGHWGPGRTLTETITGQFAGDDPVAIQVSCTNGGIRIKHTDNGQYRAEVEYLEDEGRDDLPFSVKSDDRSLVIRADRRTVGVDAVKVQLWLPRSHTYNINAGVINGRIKVDGLTCEELTAATANGRMEVSGCKLNVGRLKTRNGRLEIECGAKDLVAVSGTGRIRLRPDPACAGRYTLTTNVGSIECELERRDDTGYRVDASSGMGRTKIGVPGMDRTVDDRHLGGRAVGKTEGYEDRDVKIDIEAESRVGSISVYDGQDHARRDNRGWQG